MRVPFSVVFLLLVLGEITAFILVGQALGVLATLGLVLFGMVAGAMLLRWQGMATLMRVRADMEAGRRPGRPLAEGATLAVAALLIVVPGFLTDMIGLLMFLPPVRRALWVVIERNVKIKVAETRTPQGARRTPVVDLDQSEYDARPRADSPWRHDRPQA